jgi:hypothetical protein
MDDRIFEEFLQSDDNIKKAEEVFDEDFDDMRERRKKRRPWAFPLGALMLILAAIGLFTITSSVVGFVKSKTDNSKDIAYYNEYLTWIIANDPDSFDDISKANETQLLDISILSLLYDELNTSDYELTEEGLAVPAGDVESYYNKIFSSELPILHKTVTGFGYTFTYDSRDNMYYIPITGVSPPFTPRVIKVKKSRETVEVTVGYIGVDKLQINSDGTVSQSEPDKYMKITLRKSGGAFKVYSIQTVNPLETGD